MTWQRIDGPNIAMVLYRAAVPGGWLICTQADMMGSAMGVTFMPDANHEWDGL